MTIAYPAKMGKSHPVLMVIIMVMVPNVTDAQLTVRNVILQNVSHVEINIM